MRDTMSDIDSGGSSAGSIPKMRPRLSPKLNIDQFLSFWFHVFLLHLRVDLEAGFTNAIEDRVEVARFNYDSRIPRLVTIARSDVFMNPIAGRVRVRSQKKNRAFIADSEIH